MSEVPIPILSNVIPIVKPDSLTLEIAPVVVAGLVLLTCSSTIFSTVLSTGQDNVTTTIPEDYWWRVRERLNLWAEGKATCEGVTEKFLVDKDTRHKVTARCSFILVCEKKSVSRELMEKLQGEGYKLNVVATAGHSSTDVQEVALSIADEMGDNPTFYILVLHDYDLDGLEIYYKLKERYRNAIDVGVGPSFINELDYFSAC